MSIKTLEERYQNVDLTGKQILVIGGTAGIGMGFAKFFSKLNANVIIVGRNEERGSQIVGEMDLLGDGNHAFIRSDAQHLSSAIALQDTLNENYEDFTLDYLVMTQSIATLEGRTETDEGIDQKLALHYYSRVAYSNTLMPFLQKSEDPRVLFILSGGVHSAYKGYATDPALEREYSLKNAADAAGFYSDIAIEALHNEYPSVAFYHASPGFVDSSWGTDMPFLLKGFIRIVQRGFGRSTEDCAKYLSKPLLLDERPENGWLIYGEKGETASALPEQEEARDIVWDHTVSVLRDNNILFRN